MMIGTDGVYSYTFEHEQRPHCPVCGGDVLEVTVPKTWTVERFIESLVERQDMCVSMTFASAELTSMQPGQEAVAGQWHKAHLLPGATSARSAHSAEPGETSVRAHRERRRHHGHCCVAAVQSLAPGDLQLDAHLLCLSCRAVLAF